MGRKRCKARNVIIFLIIGAIIFLAGFLIGEIHAIGLFTKLGYRVLETQGIDLNINAAEIARGIFQYQNNIK